MFFLVSGFLLYRPFVAGRLRGGRKIRIRDFARRRLLRIVPAYWVALTLLAIYPTLDGGVFGRRSPIYYGFAQTYFHDTLFGGLTVAWSLGTEMSFYVLLPFYAACSLPGSPRAAAAAGGSSVELAMLTRWARRLRSSPGPRRRQALVTWATRFPALRTGSRSGWARRRQRRLRVARTATAARPTRATSSVTPLARAFVALTSAARIGRRPRHYDAYSGGPLHYIWALIAIFVLLPAVFPGAGGGPRLVPRHAAVAWLGLVSYGIYLYHFSILGKVAGAMQHAGVDPYKGTAGFVLLFIVGLAAATAVGAASYYIVERPFLNLKENGQGLRLRKPAWFRTRAADN